jgi:multidrug efflux pump subunit AcrA (membrane-fusion protein)
MAAAGGKSDHQRSVSRRLTRSGWLTTAMAAGVAAAIILVGGAWWWMSRGDSSDGENIVLHRVSRGDFELSIVERGEVDASDVTEIRSLVKSNNTTGNAILRIVPEGTVVKKGDFLVELDSSALASQRTSQQILVNDAKAAEVEAHNNYDVAVISKREYLEGTYLQDRQAIESEKFVAEENLNRAKDYYTYSQKLASKGYVNENQLEADRFAVDKAKKDLEAAKTKLKVIDEFTKPKQASTLDSAILIAKAKWDAAKNSEQLEVAKLADIDDQIAKCTMTAPQDGIVKYAHVNENRGDQQFIVEEGAMVRERQTIIKLPNAESMRVILTVNESLVQYIEPGFAADIRPVGVDKLLHGTVERVNQYAEPTGWRTANVKEYKAFVHIDDASADLRSGMTASVTIHCAGVPNALQVPVQAMYAHGPKFYCFAYNDGKWNAREVKAGPTNDKYFVIESGLHEGDEIAMNPRAYLDNVSLPKLPPEEIQRAVPQPPRGEQTARKSDVKPQAGRPAVAANDGGGKEAGPSNQPAPSAANRPAGGSGKRRNQARPAAGATPPANTSAASETRPSATSPGAAR